MTLNSIGKSKYFKIDFLKYRLLLIKMLSQQSSVIIRYIFLQILNEENLLKFKHLTKRFNKFITNDRLCQLHYLKIKYSFDDLLNEDYLKLISDLDKRKYSKCLRTKFTCNTKGYPEAFFIRPSDNALSLCYEGILESDLRFTISITSEELNSVTSKTNNAEQILKMLGFFQVDHYIFNIMQGKHRPTEYEEIPFSNKKSKFKNMNFLNYLVERLEFVMKK